MKKRVFIPKILLCTVLLAGISCFDAYSGTIENEFDEVMKWAQQQGMTKVTTVIFGSSGSIELPTELLEESGTFKFLLEEIDEFPLPEQIDKKTFMFRYSPLLLIFCKKRTSIATHPHC